MVVVAPQIGDLAPQLSQPLRATMPRVCRAPTPQRFRPDRAGQTGRVQPQVKRRQTSITPAGNQRQPLPIRVWVVVRI